MSIRARLLLTALAAAMTLAAVPLVAPAATPSATTTTCPGTFTVLHDDHVGKLSLPHGPYVIRTSGGLSCTEASKLFARFLQDWDGNLPNNWKVNVATRGFFQQGKTFAFTVTPQRRPPNPPTPPPGGRTCPGYFTVLHNDRINGLSVPAGNYLIQLIRSRGMNCAQATQEFAKFLTYNSTLPLPSPWKLYLGSATFQRGTNGPGFRIIRDGGGGGGGGHNGIKCPGTFHVLHNDRIGTLRLPAGYYVLIVKKGLTCSQTSTLFRQFLAYPGQRVPPGWKLDAQTGTFTRGGQSFRVEPNR